MNRKIDKNFQKTCYPELYKKSHLSAFTLTEVIIVLVILGALALILIPNMGRMMPDDHNIRYKKAFYTIQEIVSDIVNDPAVCLGLNATVNGNDVNYSNIANDNILTTCATITQGPPPVITARNLDVEICERLSTNQPCGGAGSNANVLTTNGMRWNLVNHTLRDTNNAAWANTIFVDVDGGNAAPGAARDSQNGVYRIIINSDGRVTAPPDVNGDANGGTTEQDLLINNPTE